MGLTGFFLNEANINSVDGAVRRMMKDSAQIEELLKKEEVDISNMQLDEHQRNVEKLVQDEALFKKHSQQFMRVYGDFLNTAIIIQKFQRVMLAHLDSVEKEIERDRGPQNIADDIKNQIRKEVKDLREIMATNRLVSGMEKS